MLFSRFLTLCALLSLVTVGGCSSGTRLSERDVVSLQKGVTTYTEVVTRFGSPDTFSQQGTLTMAQYYYRPGTFGMALDVIGVKDGNQLRNVILKFKDGVLSSICSEEGSMAGVGVITGGGCK